MLPKEFTTVVVSFCRNITGIKKTNGIVIAMVIYLNKWRKSQIININCFIKNTCKLFANLTMLLIFSPEIPINGEEKRDR